MTEKLYDKDGSLRRFEAKVLSCAPTEDGYLVVLSRTAFFPGGGGQGPDTGTLGNVAVTDVWEEDGTLYHRTDGPLEPGSMVRGRLNWDVRFRRMQVHTGEHIISGIVFQLFRGENVGFACGEGEATLDFDMELSWEQVRKVERLANGVIFSNVPVCVSFPTPEQLPGIPYRCKLDIKENMRLVTIENCDVCACCAPHVSHTGEIGALRIDGLMRHRGGVRLHMVAGWRAYEEARDNFDNVLKISNRLSAPREAAAEAVDRVMGELQELRYALAAKKKELTALKAASLKPTAGNLCLFEDETDLEDIRELVNEGMAVCGGACGVFSGSDEAGYRYIIGSRTLDLKALSEDINAALEGQGGGSSAMIQGSCKAPRARIEAYFSEGLK